MVEAPTAAAGQTRRTPSQLHARTFVVYCAAAVFLVLVAAWTVATGARTPVIWFRDCVVLLACVAALLIAASLA